MTELRDPIHEMLVQARRAQILSAAADVFSEKGFRGATIKEIAETAHVSEGTLYNYFAGKGEILAAIGSEVELPGLLGMLENIDLTDRDAVVAMIEMGLDLSEARLPFIRTVISEAWFGNHSLIAGVLKQMKTIHERLRDYMAKAINAGAFRPMDPDVGSRLVLSLFGGLLIPSYVSTEPKPMSQEERHTLATSMVDILLDGLLLEGAEGPAR